MATTKSASKPKPAAAKFSTVDEYIASLPTATKAKTRELRKIVKKAAPDAEELISYNIPALKLNGVFIYYSGWKEHVSLYPSTPGMVAAISGLSPYLKNKGTIQFAMDEPLPEALITKIVKFRAQEDLKKKAKKS